MNSDSQTMLLAIECMTYNQKPFILDALNGFVIQKTVFPYIIILVDDASTDGEPEVIQHFIENQFDLDDISISFTKEDDDAYYQYARHRINTNCYIIYLQLKTNLYHSPHKKELYSEWEDNVKYIAICEGDDYWIKEDKLQKQVSFLENNSDYSLCCHAVQISYEPSGKIENQKFEIAEPNSTITYMDLANYNYIATLSTVFRSDYYKTFTEWKKIFPLPMGDYPLWMYLASKGNVYRFNEIMGIYRHGVGVWTRGESEVQNLLSVLQCVSKLSVVVDNEDVKHILDNKILALSNEIFEHYNVLQKEISRIRSSKRYTIGKFILHPLSIITQLTKIL